MTTRLLAAHPDPAFDWRRVGAMSTTFAAHAAVLALILAPLTPPLRQHVQHVIDVTFVEPPPPIPDVPPPPEPVAPHKPPPLPRVTRPQPRAPVAPVVAEAPSPIVAAPAPVAPPAPASDIGEPTPSASPAGATRQLAYDGALRTSYPKASLRAREQGTVVLRVRVGIDGRVERVEVQRSSGHPRLDAAARDAVLHGRFKPVLENGKAVPAWGIVPIAFQLDRA